MEEDVAKHRGNPRASYAKTGDTESDDAEFDTGDSDFSEEEDSQVSFEVELTTDLAAGRGHDGPKDHDEPADSRKMQGKPSARDEQDCHPKEVGFVDALATRELADLSMSERDDILHDIHGVSSRLLVEEETPSFVRQRLAQLEIALANAPESPENKAYRMALASKPAYVQDSSIRLSFLRAARFDVEGATRRLLLNFRLKLELFGPDVLVRDIVQEDFSEVERSFLNNEELGFLLPMHDMAGRFLVVSKSPVSSEDECDIIYMQKSILRWLLYAATVISRDQEVQRRGMVMVNYVSGTVMGRDWMREKTIFTKLGSLLSAIPLRFEAIHLCSENPAVWKPLYSCLQLGASKDIRARIKSHFGTQEDIYSALQSFAIPARQLFSFLSEKMWRQELGRLQQQRWESHRVLEPVLSAPLPRPTVAQLVPPPSTNDTHHPIMTDTIEKPTELDVLLGRGRGLYSHIGNIQLRKLIQKRMHLYEKAKYSQKPAVCSEVVGIIRRQSGRFLKQVKKDANDNDASATQSPGWIEVNDEVARDKIGHLFRKVRAKMNRHRSSAAK